MGIFGTLFKTGLDIVTLPLSVAVDVVQAPIKIMDDQPILENTGTHLQSIKEDLDDITDG